MTRPIMEVTKALEYKLKQAKFFLECLQRGEDEWATACYFSACIGALRSIPAYIRAFLEKRNQIPKSKFEGDEAWGKLHGDLCKAMPEVEREVGKWLREVANYDIHRSPVELLKEISGGYFPEGYFPPNYFPKGYFPSPQVSFLVKNPKRSGEHRNIIEVCNAGISYATNLINQFNKWYQKYGKLRYVTNGQKKSYK